LIEGLVSLGLSSLFISGNGEQLSFPLSPCHDDDDATRDAKGVIESKRPFLERIKEKNGLSVSPLFHSLFPLFRFTTLCSDFSSPFDIKEGKYRGNQTVLLPFPFFLFLMTDDSHRRGLMSVLLCHVVSFIACCPFSV
jgi:hypothetical protein